MLGLGRIVKFAAMIVAAASILVTASAPSNAQAPGVGTVRLHIVKAGFIVGVGGGSGTLYFQGRTYRLRLGGIGLGSLGIAGVDLVGTASNLHRASDIVGTYGAAGAGVTFVGGGQNARGVVLQVQGPQVGFQVSLGLGGMTIALR